MPLELTGRQKEVLEEVARGLCNKAISTKLELSELTVKNHVSSIIRKLEVKNRAQAAWKGLELGIISCPCPEHCSIPAKTEVVREMEQSPVPPEMIWLQIGKLQVCPESFEIRVEGKKVALYQREFQLLHFLMRNLGRTFSRDNLLNHVWGKDAFVEDRTVDVHIRRIRIVLMKFGLEDMIQTIRGVGYRAVKHGVSDGHVPT